MKRKTLIIAGVVILIILMVGLLGPRRDKGPDIPETADYTKIEVSPDYDYNIDYTGIAAFVEIESWEKDYINIESEGEEGFGLRVYLKEDDRAHIVGIILRDRNIDPKSPFVTYMIPTWLPLIQFDTDLFLDNIRGEYKIKILIPENMGILVRGNNYYE